jgi:FtsH-binding integral membrane protein
MTDNTYSAVPEHSYLNVVAMEDAQTQKAFLTKTYLHLLLAIGLFVGSLLTIFTVKPILMAIFWVWFLPFAPMIMMIALIGVSAIATSLARTSTNKTLHYVGLVAYSVMEVVFVTPMIYMFLVRGQGADIVTASWMTLAIFGCMTATVFVVKPDLGFLGKFLAFASISSIVVVLGAIVFGFTLGTWFTMAMIVLACGYILYETSSMTKIYNKNQYVACALSLFASIVMLFWYILRLFSKK